MTNQEAFDIVVAHLSQMEKPSTAELFYMGTPSCAYRGEDGAKCAIGCLIPDDQYLRRFEGEPAGFIQPFVPALAGLSARLLDDLQEAHDDSLSRGRADLAEHLHRIAIRHDLDASEVDRFFPAEVP